MVHQARIDNSVNSKLIFIVLFFHRWKENKICNKSHIIFPTTLDKQESPANAKGMRDSSACMKAHCEQM